MTEPSTAPAPEWRGTQVHASTLARISAIRDQLTADWADKLGGKARRATNDDAIKFLLDHWDGGDGERYAKVLKSAEASAKAIGVLLQERSGLYAVAVLARDFDALGISGDALRKAARDALESPVDMSWWPEGELS